MPKTPKSLSDAIDEEPERFVKYFLKDFKKISESKNPQLTFLQVFQKKFGNQQGLFLWNYILDNYNLTNKFYKLAGIQEHLPENFKGNINRKVVSQFFEDYKNKSKEKQEKKEESIKRKIEVPSHTRSGKEIKRYSKTKGNDYSSMQERFILARKEAPLNVLASEFNSYFGTSVTKFGVRDKRLRLLGKKK